MAAQIPSYTVMVGSEPITFANAYVTLSSIDMIGPASNYWNPLVQALMVTLAIWDLSSSAAYNSGIQPLGYQQFPVTITSNVASSLMAAILSSGNPEATAFLANAITVS